LAQNVHIIFKIVAHNLQNFGA